MAQARHKRDADARRKPGAITLAGSVAVLLTGAAVVAGVAVHHRSDAVVAEDPAASTSPVASLSPQRAEPSPTTRSAPDRLGDRAVLSRSLRRGSLSAPGAIARPEARATTGREKAVKRWTSTSLNLWTAPGSRALDVGLLGPGKVVYWTRRTLQGRDEVIIDGDTRYVTHGYLTDQKPTIPTTPATPAAPAGGLSDAPCPDTSVEHGLAEDTIRVYRAVCHAFPQVTDYIGWGPREEHDTGHAIDVMVYGDKALGDRIAAWAQDHASELNLYDILWYQRIWTPVRASEGWRTFADRGSPTANHMDHVHIGTN